MPCQCFACERAVFSATLSLLSLLGSRENLARIGVANFTRRSDVALLWDTALVQEAFGILPDTIAAKDETIDTGNW